MCYIHRLVTDRRGAAMTRLAILVYAVLACIVCGTLGQTTTFNRCDWCGENGVCVNNTECSCLGAPSNYPYFLCHNPDQGDLCQLCDDPSVNTENGDRTALSYVKYTLLQDKLVKARFKICRIRVVVSNYRIRGKSYPRCVFVRVDVRNRFGRVICSFAFKIFGYSNGKNLLWWKIYRGFTLNGENAPITLNWWRTIWSTSTATVSFRYCLCQVKFRVNEGRILIAKLSCCPFTLGFRPFVVHNSWLKSGIFTVTPKVEPQPLSSSESVLGFPICLRPGVNLTDVSNNLNLPDPKQAMSFLALTNLPSDSVDPNVGNMIEVLKNCSDGQRQELLDEAHFMITSAPFIREISGNGTDFTQVIEVFTKAAEWFCNDVLDSCKDILTIIGDKAQDLLQRIPDLAAFVARNCSSNA